MRPSLALRRVARRLLTAVQESATLQNRGPLANCASYTSAPSCSLTSVSPSRALLYDSARLNRRISSASSREQSCAAGVWNRACREGGDRTVDLPASARANDWQLEGCKGEQLRFRGLLLYERVAHVSSRAGTVTCLPVVADEAQWNASHTLVNLVTLSDLPIVMPQVPELDYMSYIA